MTDNKEIIFLKPYLKNVVWGGKKLRDEFHYEGAGSETGECWGISAHPNGYAHVCGGNYDGMSLAELYKTHRELFGNCDAEEFPLLVKILDAEQKVSIQVHPDDSYAKEHEGANAGKYESWYIMDCPADASLVIGHIAKDREQLKDMILKGDYQHLLRRIPVKKGDFILIEPGTIHAIEAGFTILETQQNCDITYRVYDYDRLVDGKLRPLHVKQSIEVINVPDREPEEIVTDTNLFTVNELNEMPNCSFCRIWKLTVREHANIVQQNPFLLCSVISGEGTLNGVKINKGMHFILPTDYGKMAFKGNFDLILSSIR